MKTLHIPHLHAIGLSLAGLFALAVAPLHAGETFRWGHFWTSQSNPSVNMNKAGLREAHAIVPVQDMELSQIAIRGGANRVGNSLYRIGIQSDDGTSNHFPSAQWLGGSENFATSAIPLNAWQVLTLPATVQVTKGTRYHLVVEAAIADASNYSSIIGCYQPVLHCYRVLDGVYDNAVGRESFNGTSWSRASSMPIVAIDTNANKAIGQPWVSNDNYNIVPTKDNRYGQTFTLDVPVAESTVELLSFSLYVSTINLAPADDLRVHLLRAGTTTPLLSRVVVDKDNLPAPGIITVETPPIRLKTGYDYLWVVESTNTNTSVGYYRAMAANGPLVTEFPQAVEASFQGTSGNCVVSTKNGAWTPKLTGTGAVTATDLVFEMELRVPDKGLVVILR